MSMTWTIIRYGGALAFAALALTWLQFQNAARLVPTELYIGVVAAVFVALGIWAGVKLTPRRAAPDPFTRNEAAVRSLGLSPREVEMLEALASGEQNKQIARRFGISPNTVKTHLARVYEKLSVGNRVRALEKARLLGVIP